MNTSKILTHLKIQTANVFNLNHIGGRVSYFKIPSWGECFVLTIIILSNVITKLLLSIEVDFYRVTNRAGKAGIIGFFKNLAGKAGKYIPLPEVKAGKAGKLFSSLLNFSFA